MMMNAATTQVRSDPTKVSILPNLMSWMSMPLSTTADCWKKICQGVIVVPMLAMISVISGRRREAAVELEVRVVEALGRPRAQPSATLPVFIAQIAAGM